MGRISGLAAIALLTACGGAPTLYETAGAQSTPVNMIDCAIDAISDEGFTVVDRNDEGGLMNAAYGTGFDDAEDAETWIKVNVIGADPAHYVIRVQTSDDDIARAGAEEIIEECGT